MVMGVGWTRQADMRGYQHETPETMPLLGMQAPKPMSLLLLLGVAIFLHGGGSIVEGAFLSSPTENGGNQICCVHRTTTCRLQRPHRRLALNAASFPVLPSGRVADVDRWLRICSDSLENLTGTSLVDRMDGVERLDEVTANERYAVLSHGTQDDPIYNYANRATLLAFQYPEEGFYQLASRNSAPAGATRDDRDALVEEFKAKGYGVFPTAIRQTKTGELFEITDISLSNVYNEQGGRVGQMAVFDRDLIVPLSD